MGQDQSATLEILIQIRDELAGLNRTRDGVKSLKKETEGLGAILRQGLGVGTGMEIARRGINLLSQSFQASIGDAFRLAEEIRDQSEALNITTEAYQVLRFELMQAGVDAGRLTMALSTQTQSLAEARTGVGAAAEAYKRLGLSAMEVEQMRPEERLIAVARATFNATDKTRAFQAAGQILGQRGLPQLLNALRSLADDGYDKVAAAAKAAGQVMADETVDMLDKAKQRIDNFKSTTLPIAAGTAIGWLQSAMSAVGATVGNFANMVAGRPLGDLEDAPTAAKPKITAPTGPIYAEQEKLLLAQIAVAERKASDIQNASLLTEHERRKALLPILREQEELYQKIIELRYGEPKKTAEELKKEAERLSIPEEELRQRYARAARSLPADGKITEEDLKRYEERNELESKLTAIRQQRMSAVDSPLLSLSRELNDTTAVTSDIINSSLNAGISSLSANLAAAAMGTGKLKDVFVSFGRIAVQAVMDLIVKLLIVRPLLTMFGFAGGGAAGAVSVGTPNVVAAAGGGSFLTNGPTNFTVGDNPGGMELVSVLPISGVGQSTVNGRAMRMAGGGNAIVDSRNGGDTFNFTYAFSGGVSREEVLGLMPQMVQATKAAVLDAQRRRLGGFR